MYFKTFCLPKDYNIYWWYEYADIRYIWSPATPGIDQTIIRHGGGLWYWKKYMEGTVYTKILFVLNIVT
jgi:hypothetical protein